MDKGNGKYSRYLNNPYFMRFSALVLSNTM